LAEPHRVSEPGPTVSVVIPAHQAERFVGESIESVLAQDRPPAEVVVVDDGSTDATADVVEGFGEAVTLLRHPDNRGEAAARNTGLAAASGAVIAMHDADDRMLPHRLRTQLEALVAGGPGRGAVVARTRSFTDDGGPIPAWAGDEPYGNALVLAWRTSYDRVGGYDESFRTGTDVDWLIRVKAAGLEVGLVDEVLTERRIHDANLTTVHPDGHQAFTAALRKVLTDRRSEA
jgi:glycosyltransferase involved in cell wall biosynthesis